MNNTNLTEEENMDILPCPFCGSKNIDIVHRDVEPQGDPWYGEKKETFVLCQECGCSLFDRYFHEGFENKAEAFKRWNTRNYAHLITKTCLP